jgi:Flp pilus assembly CpaE family ATPase
MNLIGQNANYRTIVSTLSELARFVILDLGASLQPFTQALLPYCDELFVVLEGNPNAVVTAKALIEDLQAFGAPDQNIHAILNNRILSDSLPLTSQVQEKLSRAIVAALSPAPDIFLQATRLQSPVVLSQAGSLTARQFNKLIDFIIEREALPR